MDNKEEIFNRLRSLYQPEKIKPPSKKRKRKQIPEEELPPFLQQMVAMQKEDKALYESVAELFYRQGKFAEHYEDDTEYLLPVLHYFPTYNVMRPWELRGYFGWRTRWRRGEKKRTSLSFAFMYIYELLNGIGTDSVADGYAKLTAFAKDYGALDNRVQPYLDFWRRDYVLYHQLDSALLPKGQREGQDDALLVLLQYEKKGDKEIFDALDTFSTYHISKSKLYRINPALTEKLTGEIFRKIQSYFGKHRKKTFVQEYIGEEEYRWLDLFGNAVFLKKDDNREFTVEVSPVCRYTNRKGSWSQRRYSYIPKRMRKLGKLMKTLDSLLRQELDLPPIEAPLAYKWLARLVKEACDEEAQRQKLAEKRKVVFHFDQLDAIRKDAAVTREKLMTEEERQEEEEPEILQAAPEKETEILQEPPEIFSPAETKKKPEAKKEKTSRPWNLTEDEEQFLRCLLYGKDTSWTAAKGLMASVLTDSINEKCYEAFGDTVLEAGEPPEVIEDYAEDLKAAIKE